MQTIPDRPARDRLASRVRKAALGVSLLRAAACRALLLVSLAGGVGGLASCSNIEPVAPTAGPIIDPTKVYTALTLNYPAVTLDTAAGYTTLQLMATPRDALGHPMPGLPAPSYRSTDTSAVQVTADGVVTAVQATTGAQVIAELTVGPIRHADTAVVAVTTDAAPPTLASLSIHPVAPDSAVWSMAPPHLEGDNIVQEALSYGVIYNFSRLRPQGIANRNLPLPLRVIDDGGNSMTGVPVAYTSLDPEVATVYRWNGLVEDLLRPGQVRLVAQTLAYGVAKADTLTLTVTTPIWGRVSVERDASGTPVFFPNSIRIAPSGFVSFTNRLDDSVDVIFDDPTNIVAPPAAPVCNTYQFVFTVFLGVSGPFCGAGNILFPPKGPPNLVRTTDGSETTLQVRQFPVPGIYPYHSARTGATGRIVVDAAYVDE